MAPQPSTISKTDLEEVIKVNEKAILLQAQNAECFQEIIENLEDIQKKYNELLETNNQLENTVDKSIENIKETVRRISAATDSIDNFTEKLIVLIKLIENLENELSHHMIDEDKVFTIINESLRNMIDKSNNATVALGDLKNKSDLESKDLSVIKELILELKEIAKSSEKKIKEIEDQKTKMLLLLGSGIVTAGLPAIIELVKYIITLFH